MCFDPHYDDISSLEYLGACLGNCIKVIELRNNTGPAVSALLNGKSIEKLTLFGQKLSSEAVLVILYI